MGYAYQFPDGEYDVVLMPRARLFYEHKMRIQRKLHCWTIRNRYATSPYGDDTQRSRSDHQDGAHVILRS